MTVQPTMAAAIDVALLRLRRMWARPLRSRGDRPVHMSNVMVLHAVDKLAGACDEVTIGGVAEHLDVDPSTASRLVNDALGAGFVRREESLVDARRVRLVVTPKGRRVLDVVTRYRREYLESLIADWEPAERERLATLIGRFAEAAAARPADSARLDELITEALRDEVPG